MNRKQIKDVIESELAAREKHIVNRNALDALFGAFSNPIGALGKIFLGKEEALATGKLHIQQDIMLDLLCQIDDAISNSKKEASSQGVDWTVISGEIEAHGVDVEEVTGAHIVPGAGPTELKPGTHIHVSGTRTKKVTGLKVGVELKSKEDK